MVTVTDLLNQEREPVGSVIVASATSAADAAPGRNAKSCGSG